VDSRVAHSFSVVTEDLDVEVSKKTGKKLTVLIQSGFLVLFALKTGVIGSRYRYKLL
jgi:hypothetical protein